MDVRAEARVTDEVDFARHPVALTGLSLLGLGPVSRMPWPSPAQAP